MSDRDEKLVEIILKYRTELKKKIKERKVEQGRVIDSIK